MSNKTTDDVYNDPDNILSNTDDAVDGGSELPSGAAHATNDPRGELELIDSEGEYHPGVSRDDALDADDEDANRLSDVIVGDEKDGTNS